MSDSDDDSRARPPAGWPPGYVYIQYIGKGDKCKVYEGRREGSDQRVAVKLFAHSPAWTAEERLRTQSLTSPYLVKTLDASKRSETVESSDSTPDGETINTGRHSVPRFLVMELAEGKSLVEIISEIKQGKRGKPNLRELLTLAGGLLEGLHALHDAGIFLGDLSVRTVRVRDDWQPRIARYRMATIAGKPSDLKSAVPPTAEGDLAALGTLLFELAHNNKYDVWRRDRNRGTGLDPNAPALGPFNAFIDALISREIKHVDEARKRLSAVTESTRPSLAETTLVGPVSVETAIPEAATPAASVTAVTPSSTHSSNPPPAEIPQRRSTPPVAARRPHLLPKRASFVAYAAVASAVAIFVAFIVPAPKREPAPPPRIDDLSPMISPEAFEGWMDPDHPHDCIGYQLAAFPEAKRIPQWSCDQYLTKDSNLANASREAFEENTAAWKAHVHGRPLIRVVWLAPQHAMQTPAQPASSPQDPTSPYKTQAVELKGLIYAQKELNKQSSGPVIQVVLANAGDRLKYGSRVADKLVDWSRKSKSNAPVAVLGFVESYIGTADTIRTLDREGIISIGTILAARYARQFSSFIAVRTTVELEMRAMLAAAADMLKGEAKGELLVSFGDIAGTPPPDDDEYRKQLHDELLRGVKEYGSALTVNAAVNDADVARFCKSKNVVWLYLGRWQQLRADFAQPLRDRCRALPGGDLEPVRRVVADYSAARIFDPGGGRKGHNAVFDGLRYVISGREMPCSLPPGDTLCENEAISIYAINIGRSLYMLAEAVSILTPKPTPFEPQELLGAIRVLSLQKEVHTPGARLQPRAANAAPSKLSARTPCDQSVKRRWEAAKNPCPNMSAADCVQAIFAPPRELSVASEPDANGNAAKMAGLEPYDQDIWVVTYEKDKRDDPKPACRCVHQVAKPRRPAPEPSSFHRLALQAQADCCCFDPATFR